MQSIKRPVISLYKGYTSSANYDGEPSVSNGIMYQLPSSQLSIHRVLAKFSNRVMCALRRKLLHATDLVFALILLTCFPLQGTGFRGRSPCFLSVGRCVLMQYLTYSIVIRSLSRTLPDFRIIWNPARSWKKYAVIVCYAAIVSCFAGRLMSFYIFCGS